MIFLPHLTTTVPMLIRMATLAAPWLLAADLAGAQQAPSQSSGVRYHKLVIRNALVIDGAGNPTRGPYDIMVESGKITAMTSPRAQPPAADRVIDAGGMYVMPGIIDLHGHVQFHTGGRSSGVPLPRDYVYKLWLAHGITTVRDPGSLEGIDTIVVQARLSAENRIAAPTVIPYAVFDGPQTPDSTRALVRRLKQRGAAGLKVFIQRPDIYEALLAEARLQGLPVAVDLKVQEVDAMFVARRDARSIEHWYGIPDAAIPGPQNFPDYYRYDNELDRFRWGGDIWRQADSTLLSAVLDTMLAHHVTWDPTFAVYEANRDLTRARNLPWFRDYAMPAVLKFFEPDLERHGSYHLDWTTADEVMWRNNFHVWMHWVREYARRGGNVTVGSDAGFIYHLFGFATIREMELHQEAGFHPIEVIQQATSNGARALGLISTGVVRVGWDADLAVVDGNPLHNLKVLYGIGVDVVEDGKMTHRGGVKYTIKRGIVFDAPALLDEVARMVKEAKARTSAP
ncbi:MAG: amidohydrolase family protein [Gemmatimonadetes bacterium]|nr:amidohydrolase family protein [Gemmatimonadota bacterium]